MTDSRIDFVKMNGLGNDYVFIDCRHPPPEETDWSQLARWASDRHRGIGSDGLILILPPPPSSGAHAAMRMFNSDGSEGEMCGNGVRCLAWYVARQWLGREGTIRVWTPGGPISARVSGDTQVEVDMGRAAFEGPDLPCSDMSGVAIETAAGPVKVWPVSMGNPHAVCLDVPPGADWRDVGRQVETDKSFPNRTNVEFVSISGPDRVKIDVWERGSGATMACGTGAAASLAVTHRLGLTGPSASLILPGGTLTGRILADGRVVLKGPVELSYLGHFIWPPDSENLIGGAEIG